MPNSRSRGGAAQLEIGHVRADDEEALHCRQQQQQAGRLSRARVAWKPSRRIPIPVFVSVGPLEVGGDLPHVLLRLLHLDVPAQSGHDPR
jgi:hypothetical protein